MNTIIPAEGPYINLKQVVGLDFRPFYTPAAMLNLGIKGGQFGHANKSLALGISDELTQLFKGTQKWLMDDYDATRNYFNVVNRQSERSLGVGYIYKAKHPLGWFEWYCRFYYGETSPADIMRVSQWVVGINTAWFYIATDPARLTDTDWQLLRRQQLLEWAVDPTLDPASYGCGDI
jgi:hypothetical protein